MELQEKLAEAMAELDEELVVKYTQMMAQDADMLPQILSGLNSGVVNVGRRFEAGEYFIADLVVSGMIYRAALDSISYHQQNERSKRGKVMIGVVSGDVHDVGKDIIVSLLESEWFDVIDLGVDVKPERFLEMIRLHKPDVLLLSGLMGFSRSSMQEVIQLLETEGLRDDMPVYIGGACTSEFLCKQIGADGWCYDTSVTLAYCKKAIEEKYGKE